MNRRTYRATRHPKGGVPPKAGRGEGERYGGLATRLASPSVIGLRPLPPPPTGEESQIGPTPSSQ
jgi:hypothetical protein